MRAEIKALVKGGSVTPAALGQSLGMAGLNIGKVVADINNATKSSAGLKVPITISYDLKTKAYEIIVDLPPTSQLLLKAAGVEKAFKPEDEAPPADLSLDKVIEVVKTKEASLGSDKKKALIQVLGTCVSMGFTVEGKSAKEFLQEVREGKHDAKLK